MEIRIGEGQVWAGGVAQRLVRLGPGAGGLPVSVVGCHPALRREGHPDLEEVESLANARLRGRSYQGGVGDGEVVADASVGLRLGGGAIQVALPIEQILVLAV